MSLSLLTIPLTPLSPLFPYTTLFRSLLIPFRRQVAESGMTDVQLDEFYEDLRTKAFDDRTKDKAQDRKSTRLNSSHEWISYAVFCLKKKKKQNNIINNKIS